MRKEFDFVVSLQRPDFRKYDLISLFLLIAAAAVFIISSFYNPSLAWLYIIAAIVVIAQIGYNIYERKKGEYLDHRIAFLMCFIVFFFIPAANFITIIIALLYGIAALLEGQIKFPEEIGFDKEGVTVNALFKKSFEWNVINNVILKDGLLTIDFKNNKIFQKGIEEDVTPVLEKEFNEFCRLQLQAHHSTLAVNS
jgi:hypothetical protein